MLRVAFCLLLALASATVAAREVRLSAPNSGACPEAATEKQAEERASSRPTTAPARESKGKPSVHSDVGSARPQNRWNSFLPGMFR